MPRWRNGSRTTLKMLRRETCGFDPRPRHSGTKYYGLIPSSSRKSGCGPARIATQSVAGGSDGMIGLQ